MPDEQIEARVGELQARLARLEQRDWWSWWAAILVMLLLTVAVASLTFPGLLASGESFFQLHLSQAVRGLVGLVLLFNTYTIYQQFRIKRLRRQLNEQMEITTRTEARAEEFHRLAVLDPLTGLYNRRYAMERLAAEAARAKRHGRALTVMLLDLNHFKEVNDRYGHIAGDLALTTFARLLNKAVRASDLAARMGGDEFIAILPECSSEQAHSLVNRLSPFEVDFRGEKILLCFSSGWAGCQGEETPEQLLERADRMLYANKRGVEGPAPSVAAAP